MQKGIVYSVKADVPVLLIGSPGIGKTAMVTALAKQQGWHLETVIGSLCDPTDFGVPVPSPDGSTINRMAPRWAQTLVEQEQGSVLFLDEITNCPPAIQSALLRIVHDRYVGDLKLPSHVKIIAACNPPDEATEGYWLGAALANRFSHFQVELNSSGWATSFTGYWGSPPEISGVDPTEWETRRSEIATYIQKNPAALMLLPKTEEEAGGAWPSPRSWDHASRMMATAPQSDWLEILCSTVNQGNGTGFMTWRKALTLPDPEKILSRKVKLPERSDELYITLNSMAMAVKNECTKTRWKQGWKVLSDAVKAEKADIAVSPATKLVNCKPEGASYPKEISEFLPLLQEAGLIGV